MDCFACGSENAATRKFCRACGASLSQDCQRCGSANDPGDRFCGECGASLAAPAQPPEPITEPQTHRESETNSSYLLSEERRPVTILFADIVGFTSLSERLDPEDVRDLTTECFRCLVTESAAQGGVVDKFIGDAVMVLFGAPTAHEDDPLRAARAALGMQKALARFNAEIEPIRGFRLALRIGIETGEVVTGLRDVNGTREYTAIGDAVNVAARLQSATEPGTIIIGPGTERHVRRLLSLRPVGPLHLKGKSEPILAWLVDGSSEEPNPSRHVTTGPFVGRGQEMSIFLERLGELERGRGQVISVIGDSGLGKSRLLAEARSSAGETPWWRAAAFAHEDASSYTLIRSLLAQLCMTGETGQTHPDQSILDRLIRLGFQGEIPLIARVLGLNAPTSALEPASAVSAAEASRVTSAFIEKLVEDLTLGRPSVIEMDDLHWADPSSVEMLAEILPVTERLPLVLCLAFRPERDAPVWQLRERAARFLPHRYTEIQLQPLTPEATADLAAELLGTHSLPESLSSLLDRAAGTPLWLEELVHTLRERGIAERMTGSFSPDIADLEIPDSLQGLIVARLDRLGEARVALQTASVIGRQFAHRVLVRISEDGALDDHLVQAQRADLVRELTVIPEKEYGFKHVMVQEATYGTLLIRRRRALHRLVGEALIELYADRLETLQPTLAFHFERAEEWQRAFDHTLAAIDAARRAFANREALTHLNSALSLLDKIPSQMDQRMRLLKQRAEVHNDLGDFDAARADFEAARIIAATLSDAASEAQIVGSLAMLWSGHRDYEEGLKLAEQAIEIAQHANSPRDLAEAHVRFATALLGMNRERKCQESLEAALSIFRTLGDEEGEAHTLDLLGMSSFVFGRTQTACRYSKEAVTRLRAIGDRWTEASSAIVLGISTATLGDLPGGRKWLDYALETWTEIDSVSGMSFANSCLSQVLEPFGHFQSALNYAKTGLEIAQRIEHYEWECMGLWQLGRIHRACGLQTDAEAFLREMLRVAESLQSTLWIAMATNELGAVLSDLPDPTEGLLLLERGMALGSGTDMTTYQGSVEIARLAYERGDYETALEQGEKIFTSQNGSRIAGLDAGRISALALCALGRATEGIDRLRSILEHASAWGVRPAQWRLHLGLARVLETSSQQEQEAEMAIKLLQDSVAELTDEKLHAGLENSAMMREAQDIILGRV
jgi:class 3 adenylate cyclase/tetratricopeptide (TPR) repeat protein